MNLFDLNNDILIKIEEEVAIKRKHKLFLTKLIKRRDQFYIDSDYSDFDLGEFEEHLDFKNGYWFEGYYFRPDHGYHVLAPICGGVFSGRNREGGLWVMGKVKKENG